MAERSLRKSKLVKQAYQSSLEHLDALRINSVIRTFSSVSMQFFVLYAHDLRKLTSELGESRRKLDCVSTIDNEWSPGPCTLNCTSRRIGLSKIKLPKPLPGKICRWLHCVGRLEWPLQLEFLLLTLDLAKIIQSELAIVHMVERSHGASRSVVDDSLSPYGTPQDIGYMRKGLSNPCSPAYVQGTHEP